MNAWKTFGLEVSLCMPEDKLEERFRELSAKAHPDAGGRDGDFEVLGEARALLGDAGKRLEAWLQLQGVEPRHSGVVSGEVGEMFTKVGEVTGGVDQWLDQKVTSGLGKALWQKEGFRWKSRIEGLLEQVETWETGLVNEFARIEKDGDLKRALEVRGELGFLRKWRSELRMRFGKIWEGLV